MINFLSFILVCFLSFHARPSTTKRADDEESRTNLMKFHLWIIFCFDVLSLWSDIDHLGHENHVIELDAKAVMLEIGKERERERWEEIAIT